MTRAGLRVPLTLALLAAIAACDGGEVVVFSAAQAGSAASVPSAGASGLATAAGAGGSVGGSLDTAGGGATSGAGGGSGDTVDKPCHTIADCDPSWLCQKRDCSDAEGVCLPLPVSDDPVLSPVCGCEDHITYWNDTLRQTYGISSSTSGECKSGARTCLSSNDCGPNGSCSQNLPSLSACGMPGTGQCWITPDDCATTIASDKPRWLPCPPPGTQPGAPLPPCLTTCQAVQSGHGYLQAPKNACQ